MQKETEVSWEQVTEMCKSICEIAKLMNIDAVIGIKRGGAIPAGIISYILNKELHIIEPKEQDIISYANLINVYKVLIVDDIVDTGRTMKTVNELINKYTKPYNVYYASLYVRADITQFLPHIFTKTCTLSDGYIRFPWEVNK